MEITKLCHPSRAKGVDWGCSGDVMYNFKNAPIMLEIDTDKAGLQKVSISWKDPQRDKMLTKW